MRVLVPLPDEAFWLDFDATKCRKEEKEDEAEAEQTKNNKCAKTGYNAVQRRVDAAAGVLGVLQLWRGVSSSCCCMLFAIVAVMWTTNRALALTRFTLWLFFFFYFYFVSWFFMLMPFGFLFVTLQSSTQMLLCLYCCYCFFMIVIRQLRQV